MFVVAKARYFARLFFHFSSFSSFLNSVVKLRFPLNALYVNRMVTWMTSPHGGKTLFDGTFSDSLGYNRVVPGAGGASKMWFGVHRKTS